MIELASGSGDFLFAFVGALVLGLALAQGTLMWRQQRLMQPQKTNGRARGAARKRLEDRDDRPVVT